MGSRTLASSLLFCLIGVGLAGCPGSTPPSEAPPDASSQSKGTAPPSGDQRQNVVVGGIPIDVGDRVFFAFDSSLLNADAQRTLQRQAVWLRSAEPRILTVEGHCDDRGTREYNLALGDRRASVVRDYLVAQGVPADRLRIVSYGKERPQVSGHDEAAWTQNRRAVSVPQ